MEPAEAGRHWCGWWNRSVRCGRSARDRASTGGHLELHGAGQLAQAPIGVRRGRAAVGAVNLSRTGIRGYMLCAIVWSAACKDEFPNAPPAVLSIAAARWFDTVAVSDVDTIQIRVTLVGGGDVTGVQVH